jgi:hypothetical protein
LIELTVYWLEMEEFTKKTVASMPGKKNKYDLWRAPL